MKRELLYGWLSLARVALLSSLIVFITLVQVNATVDEEICECNFSCSAIIAGKLATVDGSVLFSHNEDGGTPTPTLLHVVPRKYYEPDETFTLTTGAVIQQVSMTWASLWSETVGQTVSDAYLNEWGVAITSNNCSSSRETGAYDITDGGIGHDLRMLVAERAATAREGVLIAGGFAEALGYMAASGRCYLIADPMEGWLFQVVRGRRWVAQRVPDDEVAFIPNYYTIRQIDLSDTDNFLASPDLIDYAINKGWYDPAGGPFDFAKVYNTAATQSSLGNVLRHWGALRLLTGIEYPDRYDLPFSAKPDRLLSVEDIAEVMRHHYEGTPYGWDPTLSAHPHSYRIDGTSIRTICTNTTLESFIMQLRGYMPPEIGNVYWKAPSHPCTTAYVPFYSGILKSPEPYTIGERGVPNNPDSAYWTFKKLIDLVDADYANRIGTVRAEWDHMEETAFHQQRNTDRTALTLYDRGTDHHEYLANKFLTQYTEGLALKAYRKALELIELWEPGWAGGLED